VPKLKVHPFATAVTFTTEETMRKHNKDGAIALPMTLANGLEQADMVMSELWSYKHGKVLYDALHHFERDINERILKGENLNQVGDWRACRIASEPQTELHWGSPLLFPDTTHTVIVVIGPNPIMLLPAGLVNTPIEAEVGSVMLVENASTHLFMGARANSVAVIRGVI